MRSVEDAHCIKVGLCDNPECHSLHFIFEDEDGEAFADATLSTKYVPAFIEKVRSLAYEIETTRKEY